MRLPPQDQEDISRRANESNVVRSPEIVAGRLQAHMQFNALRGLNNQFVASIGMCRTRQSSL